RDVKQGLCRAQSLFRTPVAVVRQRRCYTSFMRTACRINSAGGPTANLLLISYFCASAVPLEMFMIEDAFFIVFPSAITLRILRCRAVGVRAWDTPSVKNTRSASPGVI